MPPTVPCPPLKADLQQIAEGGRHSEERREHETGDPQTEHILPPREDLPEAELRECEFQHFAHLRGRRAEKERREHHVDQKSGDPACDRDDFPADQTGEGLDHDQTDDAADHRTRQIKFLQQRHADTEDLADHKQQRQQTENLNSDHDDSRDTVISSGQYITVCPVVQVGAPFQPGCFSRKRLYFIC